MTATGDDGKWRRMPLKSRWYDDHFGEGAPRGDIVANRLRLIDERFTDGDEEDIASPEGERLFLFYEREPRG